MKKLNISIAIAVAVVAAPSIAFGSNLATRTGDVRVTGDLDDLPGGGVRGGENGGFTSILVGLNTGRVQNWGLLGFEFTDVDPADVATGGRLVIGVAQAFTNGNHGTTADSFVIRELYAGNTGWQEGTGTIGNTNNLNSGDVTFAERGFGTSDWLDAAGNPVDNFIGAFDGTVQLNTNTVSGYDVPVADEDPTSPPILTFDFDAATGQRWLAQGFADLVIEVIDADGMNTSRFNLINGTAQLVVTTTGDPAGDFDFDGDVDCDDIQTYRARLGLDAATTGALPDFDLVADGTIDLADMQSMVENLIGTTNGQVGTFVGDLNCDGSVDVLGDAFILVGALGSGPDNPDPELQVPAYLDGDLNLDGVVDVLGDAFILVGNLGMTNAP